ncbi:Serine/threonine-protein kinase hal4 [Fusarium oxysporum f. sp. albedinis]|nr:Serine/threonine-protein kinase hal4 [Fusarium oxysporum f. sp. albedinis]
MEFLLPDGENKAKNLHDLKACSVPLTAPASRPLNGWRDWTSVAPHLAPNVGTVRKVPVHASSDGRLPLALTLQCRCRWSITFSR